MADRVIDLLMKHKNDSGGYDVFHPITKTDNVKTSAPITVMIENNVGSYKNNDVIPAYTPIDTIIKKILQQQILPTYVSPTISLTASNTSGGNYEVGTECSPSFSSTFTNKDAGAVTSHAIKKNDVSVASGASTALTYTDNFVLGDETISFTSSCSYEGGAIKNDNFGEPYPDTSIPAGSIDSNTISYTGFRKYFYGADSNTVSANSSAEIRNMTASTSAASNGSTFTINVTAGQRRVTFAYPSTLRDVSSVKYVEFNNDEVKQFFTKTTVHVEGANGSTAIPYKVYTYIPNQAFPSNMTFKVTI